MSHARITLLIAILIASCAPPAVVTSPRWITRPTNETVMRFYPEAAVAQGVVGRVVLNCAINTDTTTNCTVTEESPEGWNFGNAAVAMSHTFRIAPGTRGGSPVSDGEMRVPIRFAGFKDFDDMTLPPNVRAFMASMPKPDLPDWDLAPNALEVAAALPAGLPGDIRGRAILSCQVAANRSLTCEGVTDVPAGKGLGAAALELSHRFRVAKSERDFINAHSTAPFLLPINFGAVANNEPVSTRYVGDGPMTIMPAPPDIMSQLYPPEALASRASGVVAVVCVLHTDAHPTNCAVEREQPRGQGFGASALWAARHSSFTPEQFGLLEGDQVRIPFPFEPPGRTVRPPTASRSEN